PLNYHLFRSLENLLNGRYFKNIDHIKLTLDQFFNPKDKNLKLCEKLPEKWRMVLANNGQYIID
ncbi:hypothetical protein WH47_05050, partial [Habropoda laboriosa]